MTDKEKHIFICMPVNLMPEPTTHNSSIHQCDQCGTDVWQADAQSQALFDDLGEDLPVGYRCVPCFLSSDAFLNLSKQELEESLVRSVKYSHEGGLM